MKSSNDKTVVKDYFNATGFDRWRRIYGDEEVNKVQRDIRVGHQQTIDIVLGWLRQDSNLAELSICDSGCGVGSLSIPLAQAGAKVSASDISERMVAEAQQKAKDALGDANNLNLAVQDLEALQGSYHTVICLDVLIHYSQENAAQMIAHLASIAESRLILSFAPKTFALSLLKKVGDFFPGSSKATRAYQHREADIIKILQDNGFSVQRQEKTSTRFYFARILEATRS
ncbi:MAG: magnesium protoporphyrin IX methyltransferase [Cyanobacteria bacterium SW_6_48_11]|jgi:magnesium-protoporphyrin O-methyltransferase|nr:MAG: magnesium protoporphyrin IX methyltransferase [Cyanobacteria bacterium QS_5_48_63]PSO82765.1 MAG: magnesium protoporphyrin IX methyltransferase [Cyanobacteria bacterium QS_4_48_99]PSO86516.1 MAG: magnesium protoporphyrin IX methyltransferase [Cyanobacteria bacterium QS_3_48_167]PSO90218.1 MAG: magnesium protoporphyrin IX methyltransferase [Cyanobacteria bacterium QS_6_48_18]PSO95055.1 MAG: magnesium protoporphyrin IX methyltransferase [Cyanobacteria bacterium QS_9_48_30]PSO98092.1 MAG: